MDTRQILVEGSRERTHPSFTRLQVLILVAITSWSLFGCSKSQRSEVGGSQSASTFEYQGSITVSGDSIGRCDPVAQGCLYPFPNDYFTLADETTDTGRRLNLSIDSVPKNKDGVSIDPASFNARDGFSIGSALLLQVDGLDLAGSGAADVNHIGDSLADSEAVVIVPIDGGEPIAHFSELDAYAADGEVPTLIIRPAVILDEATTYAVGVRGLVRADGSEVEPTDAFRAYRDLLDTSDVLLESRRPSMEKTFSALEAAGVQRSDLQFAWSFTTASAANVTGDMLSIREQAFATLGEAAPKFTVTEVVANAEAQTTEVHGTFEVPLYLTGAGEPGSEFNRTPDGSIEQNGYFEANLDCVIPQSATPDNPAGLGIYGHGLLGTSNQTLGDSGARRVALAGNRVFCGTNLIGMAEEDLPNAAVLVSDLSKFHTLSERLQQGHLNTLFLGRLLKHPDGLRSDPAFQVDGRSILGDDLVYYGISQGGIMGAATTALAQDWTRAVLGVPAVNYSILLDRSVDFDSYRLVMEPSYPAAADRQLALAMIQMLWDAGEGNGYVHHLISDPLPNTPEHQILLQAALGDHQVANVATEIEARTVGLPTHRPYVGVGRSTADEPAWGLDALSYPFKGSAMLMFDSGASVPPAENQPPREGLDPHGDPRHSAEVVRQAVEYFDSGTVIDICGSLVCVAPSRD